MILLPLLLALQSSAASDQHAAEFEDEFCAAVDQERLLRTVRELVAIGARMGGTPSGDAAAKYHEKRFTEAGVAASIAVDPELEAFQALKFSASVSGAPAVAAADDAARLELVDGCLALHSPPIAGCELELRAQAPSEASAPGAAPYALFVEERDWPAAASLPADRGPRVFLVAFERRVATSTPVIHQPRGCPSTVVTVSKREAQWLRPRLAAGGAAPRLAIAAEVFDGKGTPRTAIGELAAKSADAPILLFCAHGDSDSGSPGADDNASGDAVVVELACAFAALAKEGLELPFTLRFAVWGSEIHSSRAYFDRVKKDGSAARHLAVVNFDEAGTGAERDCVYFEPDNVPLTQPLVRLGLEMAGDFSGREGCWSEYTSNAGLGGTDSYVFAPGWRRGGGKGDLPALTIFTAAWGTAEEPKITEGFRSPGWKGTGDKIRVDYSLVYHETGDRPEATTELEPWNMTWVTKAAGLLALRLADSPETMKKLLDRP